MTKLIIQRRIQKALSSLSWLDSRLGSVDLASFGIDRNEKTGNAFYNVTLILKPALFPMESRDPFWLKNFIKSETEKTLKKELAIVNITWLEPDGPAHLGREE